MADTASSVSQRTAAAARPTTPEQSPPQPQQQQQQQGKSLWARALAYVWSFLPGTQPAGPANGEVPGADFGARFAARYATEGREAPAFYSGSYTSAAAAARGAGRALVLYLHSPVHENTPAFCRDTLCDARVRELLATRCIVYGADIEQPHGWRLALERDAESFPFVAVLVPERAGHFAMVERVAGCTDDAPHFVARLTHALDRAAAVSPPAAAAAAAPAAAQQQQPASTTSSSSTGAGRLPAFNLRAAQQAAYQRALEADQAKERAAAEARAAAAAAEAERRARHAKLFRARAALHAQYAACAEPAAGTPDAMNVAVRLPSGQRVVRRFARGDPLAAVFAFADTALHGPFPAAGVTEDSYVCATAETTGAVLPFALQMPLQGRTFVLEDAGDATVGTLGSSPLLLVRMDAPVASPSASTPSGHGDSSSDDDESGSDDDSEEDDSDDDDNQEEN